MKGKGGDQIAPQQQTSPKGMSYSFRDFNLVEVMEDEHLIIPSCTLVGIVKKVCIPCLQACTHIGEIRGSLTKRLLNNVEYDNSGDGLIIGNLHTRMPYRSKGAMFIS